MRPTLTLGRLAGIRVGVHWSVLVIVVLLAAGLAGRFPEAYPDRPAWEYWAVGVAAALTFMLSLLAHEISHALVARRNGVQADEITLWLLGGVARLRSEAPTPGAELRIAGVGPLVSLAAAVVFGLAAGAAMAADAGGLVVEALAWLSGINLLLAVFNSLPAAPLDGGRLLRAVVWRVTGSPLRATVVATGAGRALGWLLVGAGLFLAFGGAVVGGFWLAIIGLFLIAAATAEGGQARLRELLGGVPVRQAMTPEPTVVPGTLTVRDLLADPRYRYRHSAFPVVDPGGRALGLVTVRDAAAVPAEGAGDTAVSSVMIPVERIPTPGPDDALAGLLPALQESPAHRALVLREGRPVGIVSTSDVSRVTSWLASPGSRRDGR
ncbi:site-2 protease family protein [Streptomyces aidingensis]|uniref:Zinc metalloprotease n=1 Tax=Streptomyces aidingensis TaxID=910347 RepID=A0A1I1PG80_9ACTN|nr:site-2 protease family protein [Streptomyces aidingensis]SFD06648.1 Zn-dependent protease (includes SpoIVFB) [Streptomyces aidingensis]